VLVALSSTVWSQATVKTLHMRPISSVSGKDVYQAYCLSCHGEDLRGHGPGAVGLQRAPADLTTIALRNGGKFVQGNVEENINRWNRVPRGLRETLERSKPTAQDNADVEVMPVFGPLFAQLYPQEMRDRVVRVANLVAYLKSKQVKAPWPDEPR
jgi:mono/diheme cytochrome c family protein